MHSVKFEAPDVLILSHQRSGTHFLEASLASHPKVHRRGECFLKYKRDQANAVLFQRHIDGHIFTNRPGRLNIGILMYGQVTPFERLCGPLSGRKIVHLLRRPECIARSEIQKRANRLIYGSAYKSHYSLGESPPPNVGIDPGLVTFHAVRVRRLQSEFCARLDGHRDIFVAHYEDITHDAQTNRLPKAFAKAILAFLGLEYHPLTNRLRKNVPAAAPAPKRRRRKPVTAVPARGRGSRSRPGTVRSASADDGAA